MNMHIGTLMMERTSREEGGGGREVSVWDQKREKRERWRRERRHGGGREIDTDDTQLTAIHIGDFSDTP